METTINGETNMTKNTISKFILNRGLAHVKRYHNTPLHEHETVAEHSFYVAIIARSICGLLEERGEKINTLEVIEKALIHDIEEMYTGDILQPYKYADPQLKKLMDTLNEKSVNMAFEGLPESQKKHFKEIWMNYHEGKKIEDKIVKISDKLSLVAFCLEQMKLGNKFMVPIFTNGMNLLEEYKDDWLKDILADINKDKEIICRNICDV